LRGGVAGHLRFDGCASCHRLAAKQRSEQRQDLSQQRPRQRSDRFADQHGRGAVRQSHGIGVSRLALRVHDRSLRRAAFNRRIDEPPPCTRAGERLGKPRRRERTADRLITNENDEIIGAPTMGERSRRAGTAGTLRERNRCPHRLDGFIEHVHG